MYSPAFNPSAGHFDVLRFGDFELNLHSGELRKCGKALRLQPQPAKVLSVLARQPGKLVPPDQLKDEIWGDATFVNFEEGLNFCILSIRSIRAILHDSADEPRFIETLPRSGYRFITPVEQLIPETSQRIDSLAVLPLEKLVGPSRRGLLCRGMTDELITELAKIRGLRVISRTSVKGYRGSRKSLPEIARRLSVSAILEGTVLPLKIGCELQSS